MSVEDGTVQRITQNSIDLENGTQDTSTGNLNKSNNVDSVSKMMYFIGVVYVLCASTALSFQACWVKFGKAEGFKPFQMLLGRGIIQLFFTAGIDVYDNYLCTNMKEGETPNNDNQKPKNLSPQNAKEWMWVSIRGVLGFFTAYGNYYALTLLPLGDGAAIFATFPLWTVILAAIFLKEKILCIHIIALILGVGGVILITQPPFLFSKDINSEDYSFEGVALCLSASFVNGFAFLVLRKLKNIKATYSVYAYSFGAMIGSLFMGALDINSWKAIDFGSWYQPTLLFTLGFFGFAGQYLKTKAIQYIPAGVASLIRSTDVLFGYCLQMMFWHKIPNTKTIVGAVCVALPIILISWAKLQKSKQQLSLQSV